MDNRLFPEARSLSPRCLIDRGFSWPEAPRWHDGALYVSDMYAARVLRVTPEGECSVHLDARDRRPVDGAEVVLIGTGFLPDGRMLVNSMFEKLVLVFDGHSLDVHADLRGLAQGPINDMVVDSAGRAYVTQLGFDLWKGEEPRESPILVVEPDGTPRVLEGAGDFGGANGIGITAEGDRLVTAENTGLRITALDLDDAGTVSSRSEIAPTPALGPGIGPDGIAVDAAGGCWYALPGSEYVVHLDAGGQADLTVHVPFADGIAVACALGGENRSTLYITVGVEVMDREKSVRESLGSIWAVDVPVGGGATRP